MKKFKQECVCVEFCYLQGKTFTENTGKKNVLITRSAMRSYE